MQQSRLWLRRREMLFPLCKTVMVLAKMPV